VDNNQAEEFGYKEPKPWIWCSVPWGAWCSSGLVVLKTRGMRKGCGDRWRNVGRQMRGAFERPRQETFEAVRVEGCPRRLGHRRYNLDPLREVLLFCLFVGVRFSQVASCLGRRQADLLQSRPSDSHPSCQMCSFYAVALPGRHCSARENGLIKVLAIVLKNGFLALKTCLGLSLSKFLGLLSLEGC
jgi:hypothetical protein